MTTTRKIKDHCYYLRVIPLYPGYTPIRLHNSRITPIFYANSIAQVAEGRLIIVLQ